MQKWEYGILIQSWDRGMMICFFDGPKGRENVRFPGNILPVINQLGAAGWEMVQRIDYMMPGPVAGGPPMGSSSMTHIFKRPVLP